MTDYATEQERFWAGRFGDEYTQRNAGQGWIASNVRLFGEVLGHVSERLESVIELGANRGLNLRAIATLLPDAKLSGLEINAGAAEELRSLGEVSEVFHRTMFDFEPPHAFDLAFTK